MHAIKVTLAAAILGFGAQSAAADDDYETARSALIDKTVALWQRYDVVAFGEAHGERVGTELRMDVVRHPDFARQVGVILIEAGNAFYQPILDRYIAGEDVAYDELAWVWQATGTTAWSSPVYYEFLQTVRAVNQELDAGDRVRVLAGDFGIDLDSVKGGRDMLQFADRGDFPAHLADCEILDKGLKGMLIYGGQHIYHNNGMSFVPALDRRYPHRIATVEAVFGQKPGLKRLGAALGLGATPEMVKTEGTAVAEWNLYETLLDWADSGQPMTIGGSLDYLLYLGEVDAVPAPAEAGVLEAPAYVAWRARYFELLREMGDLMAASDMEGYKEWGEYSCT